MVHSLNESHQAERGGRISRIDPATGTAATITRVTGAAVDHGLLTVAVADPARY